MWLIALLWFVLIANLALDVWERKRKNGSVSWLEIRGDFFATMAFGLVVGGTYGFLLMFPVIGKKPFPNWLGFALALGLFLMLWFGATFATLKNERSKSLSPRDIINECVCEEQIGMLGFFAIIVAGVALIRFDVPIWVGFLLLLPIWIILFYLWGFSNWILVWIMKK